MCWCRLTDRRCCLTIASLIGVAQLMIATPIFVLSLMVFFESTLGHALSPYWAASTVFLAGLAGVFIRPTRLATCVTAHIILNMLSMIACGLATFFTLLYSTATRMSQYDELQTTTANGTAGDCLFAEESPLYTPDFRSTFRSLDSIVTDCRDLSEWWEELLAIACLCLVAMLVAFAGAVGNCATPCLEDRYKRPVKQYSWDIADGPCYQRMCCCCSRKTKKDDEKNIKN